VFEKKIEAPLPAFTSHLSLSHEKTVAIAVVILEK
jgi:phosphopantetheinyl transferase (holo-ACP synthase)